MSICIFQLLMYVKSVQFCETQFEVASLLNTTELSNSSRPHFFHEPNGALCQDLSIIFSPVRKCSLHRGLFLWNWWKVPWSPKKRSNSQPLHQFETNSEKLGGLKHVPERDTTYVQKMKNWKAASSITSRLPAIPVMTGLHETWS